MSFNPIVYFSYKDEINAVKSYIGNRIAWLNMHILNMTQENIYNCEIPLDDEIKELDYEIEDEGNDDSLSFQFLSNFHLSQITFIYLNIILFIIYLN